MINYKVIDSIEELLLLKEGIKFLNKKWAIKCLTSPSISYEFNPTYCGPEEFYLKNCSMSKYWDWLRNNDKVKDLISKGYILPEVFSINAVATSNDRIIGFGYYHAKGVTFGSDEIDYLEFKDKNFIGCFRGNDFVYVDHDFRGRGVGTNLVKLIIKTAKHNNLPLMLNVLNESFRESLSKRLGLIFDEELTIIY